MSRPKTERCKRGHDPVHYRYSKRTTNGRVYDQRRCILCDNYNWFRKFPGFTAPISVVKYDAGAVVAHVEKAVAHDPDRCDPDTPERMCPDCFAMFSETLQEAR